jgi:hypothetical protein
MSTKKGGTLNLKDGFLLNENFSFQEKLLSNRPNLDKRLPQHKILLTLKLFLY